MGYMMCEKCGNFTIQVIGDREYPCGCDDYGQDIDAEYERMKDEKIAEELALEQAREKHFEEKDDKSK